MRNRITLREFQKQEKMYLTATIARQRSTPTTERDVCNTCHLFSLHMISDLHENAPVCKFTQTCFLKCGERHSLHWNWWSKSFHAKGLSSIHANSWLDGQFEKTKIEIWSPSNLTTQWQMFFCYNFKNVHNFPSNLACSYSNECLTVCIQTIHSTWRVYTHYLVMLRDNIVQFYETFQQKLEF